MSTALQLDQLTDAPPELLIRCWNERENPLTQRRIRAPRAPHAYPTDAQPRYDTGPVDKAFDFCGHIERLCIDIAARSEIFAHIDVSRILFAVTQARNRHTHGLQARVTPLRFRNGKLTRQRRGISYQVQRYFIENRDILYLVTFCLPRFLDLDFDEKFVTLFHELYHIGPDFDGDLRRHKGRYSIHSHSQRAYDRHMAELAREYLGGGADSAHHAFLRLDFTQLEKRHGKVVGVFVPRPKIVPIPGHLSRAAKTTGQTSSV